jgi:hypothetical protein
MDDDAELRRFAELLMRLVRDKAIAACDARAAKRMGGPIGRFWQQHTADDRAREAVQALVPEIVDAVLFRLLTALDQGDLPLAWQREDGSWADLYEIGGAELAGWFIAGDGWRARYSSQRFVNPDPDGADDPDGAAG